MVLAQIDINPETVEAIRSFIFDIGVPAAFGFALFFIVLQQNKNTNQQNKTISELASSREKDKNDLERKLDSTQQSFDRERQAWDTERETFLDERNRLKQELERSTNNEADMAIKIKALNDDIDILRKRVGDLETERELDKIEKKQILDESARIEAQNKTLRKDNTNLTKERNTLERLIAQQAERITSMEKRVSLLEQAVKSKDHELSKAHGTIVTLTDRLMKLTDDTQELPDFKEIESAGNEVITPVVAMDLNIDDPEATTIIEVTPVDTPTDDNASNDDDNIIEDKSA